MSRRPKAALSIALFPFLAVLICTMGALIVLLVVELGQMRADVSNLTAHAPEERPAENLEQLRAERENQQWRLDILQKQRDDMAQKLAERRLELGHLDDHVGRLRQQLAQLKEQADQLAAAQANTPADPAAATAEQARLREQIAAAQTALAEAEAKARQKKRSFAVVPYDGPNGTRRRPIYVECTADAIILQPEGIALTADDLSGPLDAGNPLDSALRVIREYLAAHGGLEGSAGEPYPLLLVRPEGAWAYAYARGAMKSWDAEFGYELLDSDMQLAYPPADRGLAEVLKQAVAEARRRQEILAAAAPARYAKPGTGGGFVRASSRGGFEFVGNSPASGGSPSTGNSGAVARGNSFAPGNGQPNGELANANPTGPGAAPANSPANATGQTRSNTSPGGAGQSGATGGAGGALSQGASAGSLGAKASTPGFAGTAFAKNRGANWGLPNMAEKAVPITRPIRARCSGAELVLVPERADYANPTHVPFAGDTRAAVDQYVNVLWKYMETWGLAGTGMYWKPVLRVDVTPDGEERFAEFTALLRESGIGIERATR